MGLFFFQFLYQIQSPLLPEIIPTSSLIQCLTSPLNLQWNLIIHSHVPTDKNPL